MKNCKYEHYNESEKKWTNENEKMKMKKWNIGIHQKTNKRQALMNEWWHFWEHKNIHTWLFMCQSWQDVLSKEIATWRHVRNSLSQKKGNWLLDSSSNDSTQPLLLRCWVPMLPGSSASTAPVHDAAWVLCFNGTSSCWVLCFNGTSSCTQLGAMLPGSSASTAPVRCFQTSHSPLLQRHQFAASTAPVHSSSHSSMSLSSG